MTLSYVLPVHNEEKILRRNVERLAARLRGRAGAEIILVENGSSDQSWPESQAIARESRDVPIRALTIASAGIGYAYAGGLEDVLARSGGEDDRWIVLTAADLPFGFTDLEAFERAAAGDARTEIFIGSKAHADSRADVDRRRRLASRVYRVARRVIAGMRTGDSQGSIFIRARTAARLAPRVRSRGFFYSTELVYLAERGGAPIVELPVTVEDEQRRSTVRPFRHGMVMLLQLIELRARTR